MTTTPTQLQTPTNPPPAARPAPMAPAPIPAPPRQRRRWPAWWKNAPIHLILMAGVVAFLFPFVWMLSTSVKTDEELTDAKILPQLPTFLPASPYVISTPEPTKPYDAPPAVWEQALPRLLEIAELRVAAVQAASPPVAAQTVDAAKHRESAARVLVDRTVVRLNRQLWDGPEASLLQAFTTELTDAAASAALNESLATFELLELQLRTLDLENFTLDAADAVTLEVESGEAELAPLPGSTLVRYRFDSPGASPIVLRYVFRLPDGVTMERLHKLIVSLKADDSWHTLDATLDIAGQRWTSRRTTPLAQHRPMSISFQPPTFDDQTDRAKTWVPLRIEGAAPTAAAAATDAEAVFRLILSPSSTREAIAEKVSRNYERAFYAVPFWRYVFNSGLLVVLTVAGAMFSSAFVAYAFARLRWPGRSIAFGLLLSTMMLPAQVTMIPSFMIWRTLGWYNTLNPLWVPAWFGGAFFIFLMVQHMRTIPKELEEAARIDGLNAVQSWWYVILPQVRPSLAAIAILSFMGAWNEFMGPLIYLRDQAKFPLALGLFGMRVDQGGDWTMMMAGNVLMTVPIIVVFFLFQRYFVQGMTMTGMKG